ncbi:MAG: Asp-tRNA(Asn)/Glu-tRNA(Gln) amidotransferase subunit GatA [Pirellula sp.]|jgi:aspartyl-tRNA(Asn)/glutamyl-tRNA(Gln) amidotransferase subunit A
MEFQSLDHVVAQLSSKQISSLELTRFYLDRIRRIDPQINSFVYVDESNAIEEAEKSDARRAQNQILSELDGVPISLKDNICTRGTPTSCGSRILSDYRSPFDAEVVARLRRSGLIILGKTNLDEFAMGGSTETSCFGASHNPWDASRTCGGSSGGSAAAVAASLSPVSLGSDTGGSIRQPAAFCGVCGLKPTYGRVSRYGLVAYASSLDQIGPFGRTVKDIAKVLNVVAGHDSRDSTSLNTPQEDFATQIEGPKTSYRIGVVREHLDHPALDEQVRAAILHSLKLLQDIGHNIVDLSMPHHKYAVSTYYIVAPSEASSNLSRYDGAHFGYRADLPKPPEESPLISMYKATRSLGFGDEVKRRIMLGTFALSAGYSDKYYVKALQVRRLIRNDYDDAFRVVDAILGPTTPTTPFTLGEKVNDPVQMYLEDLYTVSANLAGVPALSLPVNPHSSGLPIGVQLQAAPLQESKLLRIAHELHREIGYIPRVAMQ